MKKRFFTLTEILVVMALIALLGTIGFGSYRLAVNAGRRSSTQSVLTQLGTAFKEIRSKTGSLPRSAFQPIHLTYENGIVKTVSINSTNLSAEQLKIFKNLVNTELLKGQMTGAVDKDGNGNGNLTDSWGGVIYYAYPGIFNKTGFDLIAPGPDNAFGTDETATPPTSRAKYYESGELISDDIVNF